MPYGSTVKKLNILNLQALTQQTLTLVKICGLAIHYYKVKSLLKLYNGNLKVLNSE